MQPWQGAGAGQAIEDSLLLSSVMSLIDKTSRVPLHMQVRMAFAAFDTQRRPRAQRVASLSRGMSYIMTGRAPGIQLHKEKLEQALTGRWDYIWYVDLNSEVMEAKRLFEESMWLHY